MGRNGAMPSGLGAKLFDFIHDVAYTESRTYSFGRIAATGGVSAGQAGAADGEVPFGKYYVTITLKAEHIEFGRKILTSYYPAVRCFATVAVPFSDDLEIARLTNPNNLVALGKQDATHLVSGDFVLLGPVPYVREFDFAIALHALPASNLAAPYIKLIEEIGSTAVVPALSAAAGLAGPIKAAIDDIAGTGTETIEVGYAAQSFAARTGYYAAVAAPDFPLATCTFDGRTLLDKDGKPVGKSYMVFSVASSASIDSWWTYVPGLVDAVDRGKDAHDATSIKQALEECVALIRRCDRLLAADRERACKEIRARFAQFRIPTSRVGSHVPGRTKIVAPNPGGGLASAFEPLPEHRPQSSVLTLTGVDLSEALTRWSSVSALTGADVLRGMEIFGN
jgi:hypothetical protein